MDHVGDVDSTKPEPDLVHVALQSGGGPSEAVMVGDSVFDCEAAKRLDVPTLAVLTGGFSEQELSAAGARRCSNRPAPSSRSSHAPRWPRDA